MDTSSHHYATAPAPRPAFIRAAGTTRRTATAQLTPERVSLVQREVELEHIDPGLAYEAQRPPGLVFLDHLQYLADRDASGLRDPLGLQPRVRGADLRVETAAAGGHRVRRHPRRGRCTAPDRHDRARAIIRIRSRALHRDTSIRPQERAVPSRGAALLVDAD